MSWEQDNDPWTFRTGSGVNRKDAIGPTVNYGPSFQRYLIRRTIYRPFRSNLTVYDWANWNPETREFDTIERAGESDWVKAWELGWYIPPEDESIYTPEEVAEANRKPAPNLSFLNDNRTEVTAAAVVVAAVLIIVIARA